MANLTWPTEPSDARIDHRQCRSGADWGGCHRACMRRFGPCRLHHARQSARRRKQRSGLRHRGAQPDVAQRGHRKASQRPAGLQHARLGVRRSRVQRAGAGRFQQGDQPRSELHPGLCQSRPGLSQDQQARSGAGRLRQGVVARCRLRRRPMSAAAWSRVCRARAPRPWPISTKRSRSSPTMRRPITAAACSIRPSISTNSPSTISPPRSGSPRSAPTCSSPAA